MAGWTIEMLGRLRAVTPERVVERFRTQKTAALLAYLAYHPQRPHSREELIELLWPQEAPEASRNSLSTALWWLRQQLDLPGAPVLLTTHTTISLNASLVRTDVERFEAALRLVSSSEDIDQRVKMLAEAVELYRGPLLPGSYEDWVLVEQTRLAALYNLALRQLAGHFEQAGKLQPALTYATQAVRANPLSEEAHLELMRLLQLNDQPAAALRQYRELTRMLEVEFGAAPGEASRALAESISQLPTSTQATVPVQRPLPTAAVSHAAASGQGGAVPLFSPLYLPRAVDEALRKALLCRESLVLIQGPAQTGKSSLLARGLQAARDNGARVILTDLQKLTPRQLASGEQLLRVLADWLRDQLELETDPEAVWGRHRSPAVNFERYLSREVLDREPGAVVWALDEVDRLFTSECGAELFRLFRAWHNERALDPHGPWNRLTLVLAYSSEAHLFIRDHKQSPFNVGMRLEVEDLTRPEVEVLQQRFGRPLADVASMERFLKLTGGHPYLTIGCLGELQAGSPLGLLETRALREDGWFGEHLAALLRTVRCEPQLADVVRQLLRGRRISDADGFYQLRSAGVVTGHSPQDCRLRCGLYERYLRRHLT